MSNEMQFHYPKHNESAPRINLMGETFSGKSGLALAAWPGLLGLSPNPDGLRVTSEKVCGYTPDIIKISMFDPFDAWRQFRTLSWNIVRADNGQPLVDEDNAYEAYVSPGMRASDIDGVNVVILDEGSMPYPFWHIDEKTNELVANYSAILLDDIDIPMRQALEEMLRVNGVNASTLMSDNKETKVRAVGTRAQTYQDYRTTYSTALIEFDDIAKKMGVVVISTTKVTLNDKNSQGKDVLFQPDFGSEAFSGKSPFISMLEVNFHVVKEVRRGELLDIPAAYGLSAGRFERQLNSDPNDNRFLIKNRYKYASQFAPANLREVLRVEAPAYYCPYLNVFTWHEELSADVADAVFKEFRKLDRPRMLNDAELTKIWLEFAKKYSNSKYYCADYSKLDEDEADQRHLTRFTWAVRDGLHRGYIKFKMYVERRQAMGLGL